MVINVWAGSCSIIDEVLRVRNQPPALAPRLIKGSKKLQCEVQQRRLRGIADNSSVLSSFGFSEAAACFLVLQCCCCLNLACTPPTPGILLLLLHLLSNPHAALCSFLLFFLAGSNMKACSIVPRTFHSFFFFVFFFPCSPKKSPNFGGDKQIYFQHLM